MPFDVTQMLDQATRTGLAQGQAMFSNALRMQQLQSQQAAQQLHERQVAQQMALQLDLYNRQIEREAEMKKAMAQFNSLTSPTVAPNGLPPGTVGAGGSTSGTQSFDAETGDPSGFVAGDTVPPLITTPQVANPTYTPNRGEAMIRAFGSLARTPAEAEKLLLDAATVNLRDAQTRMQGQVRPRTPEQIESDKALTHQRESAAKLNEERLAGLKEGKSYTPSEFEKTIDFATKRLGITLSPAELTEATRIHLGLKAKSGTDKRDAFIGQLYKQLRKDAPKSVPDVELMNRAKVIAGTIYGKGEAGKAEVATAGVEAEAASPDDIAAKRNKVRDDYRAGRLTRTQALKALGELK